MNEHGTTTRMETSVLNQAWIFPEWKTKKRTFYHLYDTPGYDLIHQGKLLVRRNEKWKMMKDLVHGKEDPIPKGTPAAIVEMDIECILGKNWKAHVKTFATVLTTRYMFSENEYLLASSWSSGRQGFYTTWHKKVPVTDPVNPLHTALLPPWLMCLLHLRPTKVKELLQPLPSGCVTEKPLIGSDPFDSDNDSD